MGYVWGDGYVWDMCGVRYVWDMCGVRYANNLLKNPATKRLSGKIIQNVIANTSKCQSTPLQAFQQEMMEMLKFGHKIKEPQRRCDILALQGLPRPQEFPF